MNFSLSYFTTYASPATFQNKYLDEWYVIKFIEQTPPSDSDNCSHIKQNFYIMVQSKKNKKKYEGICYFSVLVFDEQEPPYMAYKRINKPKFIIEQAK